MSKGPGNRGSKRARKVKARTRRRNSTAAAVVANGPFDSVMDAFDEWMAADDFVAGQDHFDADTVLVGMYAILGDLLYMDPTFSATVWRPEDTQAFLDIAEPLVGVPIVDEVPDVPDLPTDIPDVAESMVSTVLVFLVFLDETGRWTGAAEEFLDCVAVLRDFYERPERKSSEMDGVEGTFPSTDPMADDFGHPAS